MEAVQLRRSRLFRIVSGKPGQHPADDVAVMLTADIVRRAPMRSIVSVVKKCSDPNGLSLVELDCGHVVSAFGRKKARCTKCTEAPRLRPGTG